MKRFAPLALALVATAVGAAACVPPGRGYYPGYYYGQPHATTYVTNYQDPRHPWWVSNGRDRHDDDRDHDNDHDHDHDHDGPPPWWVGNGGNGNGNGHHDDDHWARHDGTPTPRGNGGNDSCGPVYWPGCDRG